MKTAEERAREHSGCDTVPNCKDCSWIDTEQESCCNRIDYDAFIAGYKARSEELEELQMKVFIESDNIQYHKDITAESLQEVEALREALSKAFDLIVDSTEYANGNLYYKEAVTQFNSLLKSE